MIDPDEAEKQQAVEEESRRVAEAAQIARDVEADNLGDDVPDLVDPFEYDFDDDDDVRGLNAATRLVWSDGTVFNIDEVLGGPAYTRPHNHKPMCLHATLTKEVNQLRYTNFKRVESQGELMAANVRKPMSHASRTGLIAFVVREQKSKSIPEDVKICDGIRNQFFILAENRGHWALDVNIAPMDKKYQILNWPIWSADAGEQKKIGVSFMDKPDNPHQKGPTFGLACFLARYFDNTTVVTHDSLVATFGSFCPTLLLSKDALWLCRCGF
jgi:hypothetical protein